MLTAMSAQDAMRLAESVDSTGPGRRAAGGGVPADAGRAPRGAPRRPGARAGVVVAGDRRRARRLQAGGPPQARRRAAAAEGIVMFERFTDEARERRRGRAGRGVRPPPRLDRHRAPAARPPRRPRRPGDARAAGASASTAGGRAARSSGSSGRGEPDLDADALATLGIDLDAVRERVERTFGAGALSRRRGRRGVVPGGALPFTPRAKKVLELSLREAIAMGDDRSAPSTSCSGSRARATASRAGSCARAAIDRDAVGAALQRDGAR